MANVNAWGHRMYPKLRHVAISGAPYKWNKLPTHKLRTLKLCNQPVVACPSYALMRNLLSFSASTLETLDVSGLLFFSDRDDDTAIQPVVLPALKALSFAYQIPDEVTEFLPSIRTPALKRLHITDTYSSSFLAEDEGILPTDDMLERMIQYLSLHQVEKLELNRVVFKDTIPIPEVKDCLMEGGVRVQDVPFTMRFLSALTSLKRLTVWASNDNFLSYLNYPAKPSYSKGGQALHDGAKKKGRHHPYLPMLEKLFVHGEDENIYWFLAYRARWTVRQKPLHVVIGETVFDKLDEGRLTALQACRLELAYR